MSVRSKSPDSCCSSLDLLRLWSGRRLTARHAIDQLFVIDQRFVGSDLSISQGLSRKRRLQFTAEESVEEKFIRVFRSRTVSGALNFKRVLSDGIELSFLIKLEAPLRRINKRQRIDYCRLIRRS